MINRTELLADLQKLLQRIEADLLERSESTQVPEVPSALRAEYEKAVQAERTAQNYEDWRTDAITQTAATWVLSCVFVRFLEDNSLIDPPRVSGQCSVISVQPGEETENRKLKTENRLERARDEHELYFRKHPQHTDREYLLSVFDDLKKLPGTRDLFTEFGKLFSIGRPETENCRLKTENFSWLSGDAAAELLNFFQRIEASTGELVHDFTDPNWDTRFLGDLYQDLSEAARKKFALLQTPEFVEEFILDRTLEPALDAFGLEPHAKAQRRKEEDSLAAVAPSRENCFKMIDPACGSGHFLLGAFPRLLDRWQRKEPGVNVRELTQRALDSIHGVDINPFAVAIAKFRLLLVAMRACRIDRLADAPGFQIHVACGDSLLHGENRTSTGQKLWDYAEGATDEELYSHAYPGEDLQTVRALLKPATYHCVIANPPYIVPKDRKLNDWYRKRFSACHMKYSLAVPFMQQIFQLAVPGGFTGQITANSFMKREFGKKLIESFFPTVDLTHVIDTSGAYIPGHGTPTTILLGRNRAYVGNSLRTVLGIRGEPSTPDDPAHGRVWSSIVSLVDQSGSQNEFVSSGDSDRALFHKHPWSIGGGGASELKELLEENAAETLSAQSDSIGITCFTLEDDLYILPAHVAQRRRITRSMYRTMIVGDTVRDWVLGDNDVSIFPYDSNYSPVCDDLAESHLRYLWYGRALISNNKMFGGKSKVECGLKWYEYGRLTHHKLQIPLSLVFGEVATHNHFVLDRGGKVFNRTAPVIKLPGDATEDDHLALLGLLNSSTACFWMKQVCYNKGAGGGTRVEAGRSTMGDDMWECHYAINGTKLQSCPLPSTYPLVRSRALEHLSRQHSLLCPQSVLNRGAVALSNQASELLVGDARPMNPSRDETRSFHSGLSNGTDSRLQSDATTTSPVVPQLNHALITARHEWEAIRLQMIAGQENLDWECYKLYGLIDEDLTEKQSGSSVSRCFPISLGQRAFEIVLARRIAAGETQSTWFERHGSTPITELPAEWPEDYRQLVERRMELIEKDPNIRLIEQPEYKRRWNTEPWESQFERALREWLLLRLETYFDFDGRMSALTQRREDANRDTPELSVFAPLREISIYSVAQLADAARRDLQFMEVAELYRDDPAFDVQSLVEELVLAESVPHLPILRYKDSGLRKRAEWEKTWDLQREEDRHLSFVTGHSSLANDKGQMTNDASFKIPVPPKYTSSDFISTGGARYWALRGKLDVPKERWSSFPHCEGPDGTLVICWAGYDHLQQAQAISAYYVRVQTEFGGSDDPRLIPLLASLIELLPWLKQWHNEPNASFDGLRMGDYFEGFVNEEARALGKTLDEIRAWRPPVMGQRGRVAKGQSGRKKGQSTGKRGRGAKGQSEEGATEA